MTIKPWRERVKKAYHHLGGVCAPYMQAEIAELREALLKADRSADELRRTVAEIIGADQDAWPDHGNAPLAIAAIIGLRQAELDRLKKQEPIKWLYEVGTPGGFFQEISDKRKTGHYIDPACWKETPLYLATGAQHERKL